MMYKLGKYKILLKFAGDTVGNIRIGCFNEVFPMKISMLRHPVTISPQLGEAAISFSELKG